MNFPARLILFAGLFCVSLVVLAAAGDPDSSFDPVPGADVNIYTISVQDDDKIIIGGSFTTVDGVSRKHIARLNADGSLDSSFDPGTGTDYQVQASAVQGDGKIIIGGYFTMVNGTTHRKIARLNADGSLDNSFNPTGIEYSVMTISLQDDGKIIIGGDFTTVNGEARKNIARLNSDGTLDSSFNPFAGHYVLTTVVQDNDKIIVGGWFTSLQFSTRNRIARLNADGSVDSSFNPGIGPNDMVFTSAVQADEKVIIGGNFTQVAGVSRPYLARLNANGTLDNSFDTGMGPNNFVRTCAVQADGKIIAGGFFTRVNGKASNHIVRLNADGSVDSSFVVGTGLADTAWASNIQEDGKLLIGGEFVSYAGTTVGHIARIHTGDDDSDGIENAADLFPNDSDNDGTDNDIDTDDDDDGVLDGADNCPITSNAAQLDSDGDSVGDVCDAFANDPSETVDSDDDGIGNNADTDDDNDGVPDISDAFPFDSSEWADSDSDGVGNNSDVCIAVSNPDQLDTDHNGFGDACEMTTSGLVKTDLMGSSIATADMDNDNIDDIIIGSPLADVTVGDTVLKDAGTITIISGADGEELDVFKGTAAKQQFGMAIAIVPDQNSDGTPDLIIGNPLADVSTVVNTKNVILKDAGNVSLYSGAGGSLIQSIANGEVKGDKFGAAVAVGDVDNDGYTDLIVGASLADTADPVTSKVIKDAGRVTVFDGIGSAVLYSRTGTQAKEFFGSAIAVNTVDDQLLVGSPGFDVLLPVKLADTGRVQVFDATDITGNSVAVFTIPGNAKGDKFGAAISSFNQDLDSDTEIDWVVGIPGADILDSVTNKIMKDAGKVKIYSGDANTGTEIEGAVAGDNFGAALVADGDINDDGDNDLVIGAPKFDVSKTQKDTGRVEVMSGTELF